MRFPVHSYSCIPFICGMGRVAGSRGRLPRLLFIGALLVMSLATIAPASPAGATSGICPSSWSDLNTAVQAGGAVILNCSQPTTIQYDPNVGFGSIQIFDTVTIDASQSRAPITIDGGGKQAQQFFSAFGNLTINSLTFTHANLDLGIITSTGTLTVKNSTFDDNSGGNGTIYVESGQATIENSTFTGNSTFWAPLVVESGTLALQSSTVAGNRSHGLYASGLQSGHGVITATDSIVADNTGGNCITDNSGTITDGGYNLESRTDCGFTNTGSFQNKEPFLGPLVDNGGLTMTMAPHANSPAIDAGPCATLFLAKLVRSNSGGSVVPAKTQTRARHHALTTCTALRAAAVTNSRAPAQSARSSSSRTGMQKNGSAKSVVAESGIKAQTLTAACPTTDQRGATRPDQSGANCDMGAYEVHLTKAGCPADWGALATDISNAADGETVALNCNSPTTITQTASPGTISLAGKHVTLDATASTAPITLDGGGTNGPKLDFFDVDPTGGLTLRGLTLTNNDTHFTGTSTLAPLFSRGTLVIEDSTFTANNRDFVVGVLAGTTTVVNSTFTGNNSQDYDVFESQGGVLNLIHDTIVDNNLGAIRMDDSSASVYLSNSILASDNHANAGTCYGTSVITDLGYNLIDDSGSSCSITNKTSLVNTDPKLGGLATNDNGLTQTMAPGSGSKAIDAIPAASCLPTDQVNNTRPDTDATESNCDIGAYETHTAPPPVTTATLDPSTPNGTNGWYTGPVTVTLSATGGTGLITTYYAVDSGKSQSYSTPFQVTGDGKHTVSFYSVDANNNTETAQSIPINIDGTVPTISGSITAGTLGNDQNGVGQWYVSPVTVEFDCNDATSGLQTGSSGCTDNGSSPSTTTNIDGSQKVTDTVGDTNGTTITGTATDNAGNTNTASVSSILVDTSPPQVSGSVDIANSPTAHPDANGAPWYNGDVSIAWSCSDPIGTGTTNQLSLQLKHPTHAVVTHGGKSNTAVRPASETQQGSGVVNCPEDSTITGEGSGLTTSVTVYDNAGNSTTQASVPVNIDRTPPTTSIDTNGVWTNHDVTLSASDGKGSGVAATHSIVYSCDTSGNNCTTVVTPDTVGTTISMAQDGIYKVEYWSVDYATNVETHNTAIVMVDKTKPQITHDQSPIPNVNTWNKGDVTVTFTCTDPLNNGVASGIKSCVASPPQVKTVQQVKKTTTTAQPNVFILTNEGRDLQAIGTATDNAGNTATDTASANIDRTPPSITAVPDHYPNGFGWYNSPVTITFSCTDPKLADGSDGSGIAACSSDNTNPSAPNAVTLSQDGQNLSVTGRAKDNAGNTTDATITRIDSDSLSALPTSGCPPQGHASDRCFSINIDQTPPTLTDSEMMSTDGGKTFTVPYTPGTWATGPVQITFTCTDNQGGSGVVLTFTGDGKGNWNGDTANPFTATVSGDGAAQSRSAYCEDRAGNSSNVLTVNDINIDASSPSLYPTFTSGKLNGIAYGVIPTWFTAPVTVHWVCTANGPSGISTCPADKTFNKDGKGLTAQGTAVSSAGVSTKSDIYTFSIDGTPPTTTVTGVPNGWTKNSPVTLTFNATDATSGVCATYYSVDGGPRQTVGGSSVARTKTQTSSACGIVIVRLKNTKTTTPKGTIAPVTAQISGDGSHTVTYWSVDNAGNIEGQHTTTVKIDTTGPVITEHFKLASPADTGWYNIVTGAPTVSFTCTDAGSGVASNGCPGPHTFNTDGANQSITVHATDALGNTSSLDTKAVSVDLSKPTISASAFVGSVKKTVKNNVPTVIGTSYVAGTWTKGPVTVHFTCADADDTTAPTCPVDQVFSSNGANQQAKGTAIDTAGNPSTTTFGPIDIATGKPASTALVTGAGGTNGWYTSNVTVKLSAMPALVPGGSGGPSIKSITYCVTPPGAGSCTPVVATYTGGGITIPQITNNGATTISYFATDVAGNVESPANTLTIKIDKSAPTITARALESEDGGQTFNEPYTAGSWSDGPVKVTFSCGAGASGLPYGSCPTPQVFSGEGQSLVAVGSVTNNAGVRINTKFFPINIDLTAPTSSASVSPLPSSQGINTAAPQVTITARDPQLSPGVNGSGIASITYTVNGGGPNTVTFTGNQPTVSTTLPTITKTGKTTITYYATDVAGNVEKLSHTTVVNYKPH